MRPWEGFRRWTRERALNGREASIDRIRELRGGCRLCCSANDPVVLDSIAVMGMALSFAVRLRKRKSGVDHTQSAKNDAISVKPGGSCTTRYVLSLRASFVTLAKWKNQMKWSTRTKTQDAMNDGDFKSITGQLSEKFWRYTRWHRIEKSVCGRGRPSVK